MHWLGLCVNASVMSPAAYCAVYTCRSPWNDRERFLAFWEDKRFPTPYSTKRKRSIAVKTSALLVCFFLSNSPKESAWTEFGATAEVRWSRDKSSRSRQDLKLLFFLVILERPHDVIWLCTLAACIRGSG